MYYVNFINYASRASKFYSRMYIVFFFHLSFSAIIACINIYLLLGNTSRRTHSYATCLLVCHLSVSLQSRLRMYLFSGRRPRTYYICECQLKSTGKYVILCTYQWLWPLCA